MSTNDDQLKQERLLVEYQAAQSSAEHHDTLIWSITGVVWAASLILLGFMLDALAKDELKYVIVLMSVLGILMLIKVWVYTYQLAALKIHKYDRCKEIEAVLGLKQHSTLKYPGGRQKNFYSAVMVVFIVVWLMVAFLALCPANKS